MWIEKSALRITVWPSDDKQTVIPGDRFFHLQGNSHDKYFFLHTLILKSSIFIFRCSVCSLLITCFACSSLTFHHLWHTKVKLNCKFVDSHSNFTKNWGWWDIFMDN